MASWQNGMILEWRIRPNFHNFDRLKSRHVFGRDRRDRFSCKVDSQLQECGQLGQPNEVVIRERWSLNSHFCQRFEVDKRILVVLKTERTLKIAKFSLGKLLLEVSREQRGFGGKPFNFDVLNQSGIAVSGQPVEDVAFAAVQPVKCLQLGDNIQRM